MIAIPGCGLLASSTSTQADTGPDRKLIVLIDATGSMTLPRDGDMVHSNRFEAARSISTDDLVAFSGDATNPLTGVRLFTFKGIGITEQIPPNPDPMTGVNPDPDGDGWFIPDAIRKLIAGLPGPTDLTPLAGSLCDATARFSDPALPTLPADTVKTLATYSDGGENNTSPLNDCFSLDTATWQSKVTTHMLNAGVVFNGTLFTDVSHLALASTPNPEMAELTRLGKAPALALSGLSDADFFASLANATGGKFRIINDIERVPVFADVNSDFAVDRTDAILLARQFGQKADPRFDLNNDGVIDFNDYLIVVSRLGVGGGQPDPYAPRDPVICKGSDRVVIDGQVIEDAGITINARGACEIVIRNSLIVSGKNAISIVGDALVKIDNSIIVGEDAVLTTHGATVLSASNTIFHGNRKIAECFRYVDRGENIWESPEGPPSSQHCGHGEGHGHECHGDHGGDHGHEGHGDHGGDHGHECHGDTDGDHGHECHGDHGGDHGHEGHSEDCGHGDHEGDHRY
ncbi:MAG TPA: dockerin type I domain-containing protein [Terriglobales bacterium]